MRRPKLNPQPSALPGRKRSVEKGIAISAVHPPSSRVETTSHMPSHSKLRTAPSFRTKASHCAPAGIRGEIKRVPAVTKSVQENLEGIIGLEVGIAAVFVGHNLGSVTVAEPCTDEKSVLREGYVDLGRLGSRFTGQGFRLREVRDPCRLSPHGVVETTVDAGHLLDEGDLEGSSGCRGVVLCDCRLRGEQSGKNDEELQPYGSGTTHERLMLFQVFASGLTVRSVYPETRPYCE